MATSTTQRRTIAAGVLPRGGPAWALLLLRLFYALLWLDLGRTWISLGLLVGAASPVAAAAGALQAYAQLGRHAWGYWPWVYYTAIASQLVLAVTFPAQPLSLEAWLWRRYVGRRWPVLPALAGLRVFLAVMWAPEVMEKLTPSLHLSSPVKAWLLAHLHFKADLYPANPVVDTMRWMAEKHPLAWYKAFLENVAIPHGALFSVLVPLGEATVSALLLLGLLTPAAAALGLLLQASFWLGAYYRDWPFVYPIIVAPLVAVLLAGAGRWGGLDALLERRRPPR